MEPLVSGFRSLALAQKAKGHQAGLKIEKNATASLGGDCRPLGFLTDLAMALPPEPNPPVDPSWMDPDAEPFSERIRLDALNGFIHIEGGRQDLARHFEQPKYGVPGVPVVIRGVIVRPWGEDDGQSQKFWLSVHSIEQDPDGGDDA